MTFSYCEGDFICSNQFQFPYLEKHRICLLELESIRGTQVYCKTDSISEMVQDIDVVFVAY